MLKVLYFSWIREKIGCSEETFDLPDGVSTIAELLEYLSLKGPGYAEAFNDLSIVRVAVNEEYANFGTRLSAGDDIALFPPVTGG